MHHPFLRQWPLAVLLLAATMRGGAAIGQDLAGGGASLPRVEITTVWRDSTVSPGDTAILGIVLDMAPGWHVQAGAELNHPDATYPTSIRVAVPEGWSAESARWPAPEVFTVGEGALALRVAGNEGRILAAVPIRVPADAAPGEYTIEATIEYQACDDQTCEMPQEVSASATITIAADQSGARGGEADAALLALFDGYPETPAAPSQEESGDAVAADSSAGGDVELSGDSTTGDTGAADTRPRFFGITLPRWDGFLGLIALALVSALGGLILNLTPCVLPVIPIKILTMMQHADRPGKNLVLGTWMAAGVVAFWVAIGLPVAVFRSVSDPSQIFGIWWVTLGIGVLIALMGVGIMGLFTLQLPKAVYAVNPKADSAHGSFLFGVMTAVLGLPCFGFVAGALLAGSATLPAATIMLIFTSLGIGMAAPYFILAVKPSLIERIPRTGPASELVKQVMGLLLLGAAAYFIGSGLIGLVSRHPYLGRQLHWWVAALFVAAGALWMMYRTLQITRRTVPRTVFLIIGLLCGTAAIMFASSFTGSAREKWIEYEAAIAARGQGALFAPGVWNRYTPAAFASARAEGYVVVLDFTAEWCINCKALKAAVLNPDPVRSLLKSDDIVSFTVDLTDSRDPGWGFLRELGHTGIPVLAVYTPGRDTPWTSNAYTARQVLDALAQARAERVASR